MKLIKLLSLFLFSTVIVSCSGESQPEEPQMAVEQETAVTDYEQIIADLESQEESVEVNAKLEQAHLDYGIYLIYNSDPSQMRESANKALREFIAVLEINPDNEKAMAEIDQIMGIYSSFPDRSPDEEIVQQLRDMGFDY